MAAVNKGLRRFDRISVDTQAFISTPLMGDATITASLLQLGKGGGLLACDLFMGVGRVITVGLDIDTDPVRAIAKVLYEYRNLEGKIHSGVSFEYMDDDNGSRLREYIDDHLGQRFSGSA